MINIDLYIDDCFSGGYRRLLEDLSLKPAGAGKGLDRLQQIGAVADLEGKRPKIRESLVRCIWFDQYLRSEDLKLEDGRAIEILSPGWWNSESGPDFRKAKIGFSGRQAIAGDVEIHIFASDWSKHGHNKDAAYDNVILHVTMWNDRKEACVQTISGQSVPQLIMSSFLTEELSDLIEAINVEEYPYTSVAMSCDGQKRLVEMPSKDEWLGKFLDITGDERVIIKSERLSRSLEGSTYDQALYEGVMESLGYKNNKLNFLQLARRAPLSDIKRMTPADDEPSENAIRIQSILFGLAGLLPSQMDEQERNRPRRTPELDDATKTYIERLESLWADMKRDLSGKTMSGKKWSYRDSRPVNYPTRRIAGMSHLIAQNIERGLFRTILQYLEEAESYSSEAEKWRSVHKKIDALFANTTKGYWSSRCIFGGKRFPKPNRLIGSERASVTTINVIIPLLLLYAREKNDIQLERMLHKVYSSYPKLSSDNITRFMGCRLFGTEQDSSAVVSTARRQQGLYQLYRDYCERDDVGCEKCVLAHAVDLSACNAQAGMTIKPPPSGQKARK